VFPPTAHLRRLLLNPFLAELPRPLRLFRVYKLFCLSMVAPQPPFWPPQPPFALHLGPFCPRGVPHVTGLFFLIVVLFFCSFVCALSPDCAPEHILFLERPVPLFLCNPTGEVTLPFMTWASPPRGLSWSHLGTSLLSYSPPAPPHFFFPEPTKFFPLAPPVSCREKH